ncbi:MAG TPA: asparagine synthase-related protein [Solirubrobacteraceae bacterium]|nr:asparagine synthase-related protein [Solirubrobacteraceae bacterium]
MPAVPPLDPLEIYAGMFLGDRRTPLPDPGLLPGTPREVLEALLRDALADGPCHVSFSGGRDSSAILAAAVHVARREGLPDPVPLTARYPEHPDAQESEWQELVVRHLGLREWTVFDVTTELDVLGAVARDALAGHGVTGIPSAHSMVLFARRAGGGTLLTGTGGDEVFSSWGHRRMSLQRILRVRPPRRAARALLATGMPRRVRHARDTRRSTAQVGLPWLTGAANRELAERWRASSRFERTWREGLAGMLESRGYEVIRAVLGAYAADAGVRLVEPFFDPRFVRAYAAHGPRLGPLSRDAALEELFGDLLPQSVVRRSTKATFNGVLVGPDAAAFTDAWDGTGLDEGLVDPDAVRAQWRDPRSDSRALPAMQAAWLRAGSPPPR